MTDEGPRRRVSDDVILLRLDELQRDSQEYRKEMYRRTKLIMDKQDLTNGRVSSLELRDAVEEALLKERHDISIQLQKAKTRHEDYWIPFIPNAITAIIVALLSWYLATGGSVPPH